MNIRDRTSEFQRCVITYKKLHNKQSTSNRNESGNNDNNEKSRPVSDFQKKASSIAREISRTAQLLSKLAILAKRKPMFNDNPVEIAELSFLIKRKIYSVEQDLVELAKISNDNNNNSRGTNNKYSYNNREKLTSKHSHNVVNLLNTKMKNISGDFKNVLEERQKLELSNRDRWGKINDETSNNNNSSLTGVNNEYSDNNSNNGNSIAANIGEVGYNSSNPFMSSLLDETDNITDGNNATNGHGNQQSGISGLAIPTSDQQLMLMEEGMINENMYLQERSRAVETIESTIQEVGNLFQQLASMVQEQGETIQRIDANVEDIDMNITGAQRELLKYFDRVKSNRWLAAKIFFIIFVFFLIWVLVN